MKEREIICTTFSFGFIYLTARPAVESVVYNEDTILCVLFVYPSCLHKTALINFHISLVHEGLVKNSAVVKVPLEC